MIRTIDNRSQLIYALTEVAQLEHTLMCQYLFAAATLKTSVKELKNEDRCYHQIELIRDWKKKLLVVAREEMQHLTYAINLLVSVGGTPTFMRPNFPNYDRFFKKSTDDRGLLMSLEKFSPKTIERFIEFEAPPSKEGLSHAVATAVPESNYYDTLQEFYNAIKAAFKNEEMFVNYADQYDPLDEKRSAKLAYRPPVNNLVKNSKEAIALIDKIIEQGEGSSGEDPLAHVNMFENIAKEYKQERVFDKDFEPARSVLQNPMTRIHDDLENDLLDSVNLVTETMDNGLPYHFLQLFNSAYEILLTWLYQVFDRHGSKEELQAIESLAFMPYMTEIIRPLMEILTRVPVTERNGYLGPGFEVTSNNFLVPKPQISHKLTIERLGEMETISGTILTLIKESVNEEVKSVYEDFSFISKSITVLKEEFAGRIKDGWPHLPLFDNKSESINLIKPKPITPGLITTIEWTLRGPSVLELEFQGWFQAWLASDPDGANEKRGATGNNFAIGDEPDFDRIIRFRDAVAVRRSHCPEIGVKVVRARILSAPIDLNNIVRDVPEFINAEIDLLDNPKFEGRNHIVAGNGEPIDPFKLSITTVNGINLTRSVLGNGEINDMSGPQRAGSGRLFSSASISIDGMKEFLKRIGGYKSPQEYLEKRIALLQSDLANIPPGREFGADAEKIKFRLKCLEETNLSSEGKLVPGFIRWTRFFFAFDYAHSISGPVETNMNGMDPGFEIEPANSNDVRTKWLIDYHLGFFDSDSLSGYIYGSVKIPLKSWKK